MSKSIQLTKWTLAAFLAIVAVAADIAPLFAQSKNISGIIKSDDGSPLPGVSIMEKGTANGTVTDADGKFSFAVSSADVVVVVSFIGMNSSAQNSLWVNANTNNFNFKDTGFTGRYSTGDPRWRVKL